MDVIEGDTQIISRIFPDPIKDSLNILVNFESRTGIWVLDWMVKDYIILKLQKYNGQALINYR